jgi:plasmid stabilization system protein ParE
LDRRRRSCVGKKIRSKIKARVRQLRRFPRIGRRVPEFGVDHIREVFVHPFRVIYLVRDNSCAIAAVVHVRRDLASLLHREELEAMWPEQT